MNRENRKKPNLNLLLLASFLFFCSFLVERVEREIKNKPNKPVVSQKTENVLSVASSSASSAEGFVTDGAQQEKRLVVPPQPRDENGNPKCTKNRYVPGESQYGTVSWYGDDFHGNQTASGEVFDEHGNTLAHLTLPMGTEVIVENPRNGKTVRAKVNDCGPYVEGRIADLSKGLARKLGFYERGTEKVIIHVI